MSERLALRFLGVGSAQAPELGSASAVVERDDTPLLMIDCGGEALRAYLERYATVPRAVFVTHAHFDHIGGLERLFYRGYFDAELRGRIRLYVPASLVALLQDRLASCPETIAEGGANFWDAYQLVPVTRSFWHQRLRFDVLTVRHHAPLTAFGLGLEGAFVYTGDTRPIAEVIAAYGSGRERVFHDCGLHGNPSHSGLDDLEREYDAGMRSRLVLYHYGSEADAAAMRARGYRVAVAGECYPLEPGTQRTRPA
jgi:ribonuclease BN (tRNA processing enzyme)